MAIAASWQSRHSGNRAIRAHGDHLDVPPRRRVIELGAARGRSAVIELGRELENAVVTHGLSYAAVGRDVGLSGWQVARVARGEARHLTIVQASELLASVGLDLSIRWYPTGRPLRDAAHVALLGRLRGRLHPSLEWRLEVPLQIAGDLRAWDARIDGPTWQIGVEAELRLRDAQAVQRRLALKLRDSGLGAAILLVADTRHNRAALRELAPTLAPMFPLAGRRALELLGAGIDPGASSLVVL